MEFKVAPASVSEVNGSLFIFDFVNFSLELLSTRYYCSFSTLGLLLLSLVAPIFDGVEKLVALVDPFLNGVDSKVE